jgi:hypothetical protein
MMFVQRLARVGHTPWVVHCATTPSHRAFRSYPNGVLYHSLRRAARRAVELYLPALPAQLRLATIGVLHCRQDVSPRFSSVLQPSNYHPCYRRPINVVVVPRRASDWISRHLMLPWLFVRLSSTTLAPLPSSPPAPALAVLDGTFRTNTSNSEQVAIIGG